MHQNQNNQKMKEIKELIDNELSDFLFDLDLENEDEYNVIHEKIMNIRVKIQKYLGNYMGLDQQ